MIDVSGGDFMAAQLISARSDYSYDFTVADLNNILSLGYHQMSKLLLISK